MQKPEPIKKPAKWMTPRQEIRVIVSMLEDDQIKRLRNQARIIFHNQIVTKGAPILNFKRSRKRKNLVRA